MDQPNEFIFSLETSFADKALQIFHFQYEHNPVYKRFVDSINCKPDHINKLEEIPFLPISLFKTHKVATSVFEPQMVFESSGTTGMQASRHYVKDLDLYAMSFTRAFEFFYGDIKQYCILGLLPSYLERQGSSLVYMVQKIMEESGHPLNGFHLYDLEILAGKLKQLEENHQKTILIGVTYALLDFAHAYPIILQHTVVMETGGMKGRRKELLRTEVHQQLKNAFGIDQIHSEYGMTELLSQAYARSNGLFKTPHWMKIMIREEDDPLKTTTAPGKPVTGAINIIDLANIHSCSFIATDDLGRLHPDGSFEVLGRIDNSDIRGCSLMVV